MSHLLSLSIRLRDGLAPSMPVGKYLRPERPSPLTLETILPECKIKVSQTWQSGQTCGQVVNGLPRRDSQVWRCSRQITVTAQTDIVRAAGCRLLLLIMGPQQWGQQSRESTAGISGRFGIESERYHRDRHLATCSQVHSQIGVRVSCLAFILQDPGLNTTRALCGLGFQSLLDCAGFPWNNFLGFSSRI